MTAPTVYYYDDPGAPVYDSGLDGLYNVLKGCLVNGYGNKAAAGWSTVFDTWSTDKSAQFTNAAGSGLIGLKHTVDPSSQAARYSPLIYVADAMQSATQPVNGYSHKTAIADTATMATDFNSTRRGACQFLKGYVGTFAQAWTLIANDNAAILIFQARSSQSVTALGYQSAAQRAWPEQVNFLFFGASTSDIGLGSMSSPSAGNFICVGGLSDELVYLDMLSKTASGGVVASATRNASGSSHEYFAYFSPFISNVPRPPRNVSSTELDRVSLYVNKGGNFYESDKFGSIPVYSARGIYRFSSQAEITKYAPSVANLKTPISVGGRDYIFALVHNDSPIYISLDAADWS